MAGVCSSAQQNDSQAGKWVRVSLAAALQHRHVSRGRTASIFALQITHIALKEEKKAPTRSLCD